MDTLALGYSLPATGRLRDFHPLEHAPAGRTTKKPARTWRTGYTLMNIPYLTASFNDLLALNFGALEREFDS